MRIRFRTDGNHIADLKAAGETYEQNEYFNREDWDAIPPAEPGDCWAIHWHSTDLLAGYAICCPKCKRLHHWTTANNCSHRDANGKCPHEGVGSCWNWTGSPEDGTLNASPSLHSVADRGGCGWHGFLHSGDLHE